LIYFSFFDACFFINRFLALLVFIFFFDRLIRFNAYFFCQSFWILSFSFFDGFSF
jgi:hypothetical protein